MEHARKLVLVEPKLFRPSVHDKAMSSLDSDITQTLNSSETDDVKISNYLSAIRRYKSYDTASNIIKPPQPDSEDALRDAMERISPDKRHKAKRLLDHLKADPDMQIDPSGQLIYRQQTLRGSKISELLSEALDTAKLKSTPSPVGWHELSRSLQATDAPRKIVVNSDLWKSMHPAAPKKKKTIPPPPPPPHPPTSKRKRKPTKLTGDWIAY